MIHTIKGRKSPIQCVDKINDIELEGKKRISKSI